MRALVLTLLLTGCGLPDADQLYGLWANAQDGEVRAFRFAETLDVSGLTDQTDVFELYLYDEGDDPVVVQLGTYTVERAPLTDADNDERPALVQTIVWSANSNEIGATYGNELLRSSGSKIVLASDSADTGKRVYHAVDELP